MRPFRDARLQALESLYRARFPHFLRVALAIVGDRERALDAVQDGFADAIRSRASFRGEGPLEAWVWRAVVNAALKAAQREARAPLASDLAGCANGREESGPSELGRLIALLPERQRLALFLRYYADLDYRSIARALDVEVGTVSATLSAAHASLRRALKGVPR
jgi:RNA polymerase sigma-70 factor (ECF subfamily)